MAELSTKRIKKVKVQPNVTVDSIQQVTPSDAPLDMTPPATMAGLQGNPIMISSKSFIQCVAKRADGERCTRNVKGTLEFCMAHATKCIYGRYVMEDGTINPGIVPSNTVTVPTIIQPIPAIPPVPITPKKRGRRRKQPIDPRFEDNSYAILWPEICEGNKVLMDRFDNIYTYEPLSPLFIGIRLLNGIIDKTALPRITELPTGSA